MKKDISQKQFRKFLEDNGIKVSMEDHAFIWGYNKDGKRTVQLDGYITFEKVNRK